MNRVGDPPLVRPREGLILPASARRAVDGGMSLDQSDVGVFVPLDAVFPDLAPTERTLISVLETLSRDDTLFMCARVNIIVSGFGDFEHKSRQEQAINSLKVPTLLDRINDFCRSRPPGKLPVIFFRGQMLELMRWVSRYSRNLPSDGTSYDDPQRREGFVKAALIASELWGKRIFRDKLTPNVGLSDMRRRALGAFRRGVDESGTAPHLGSAIGRGIGLFTKYMPACHPRFEEEFEAATGLPLRQYLGCATVLMLKTMQHNKEDPLFGVDTYAGATTYRDIFPRFFDLVSLPADRLAEAVWGNFEAEGYARLRERPVMMTADGRGIVLDPTFFAERVSVGPLFHATKGRERSESLKLFAAFGDAFERYATEALRRMYPHRPGLVDRVALAMQGAAADGRKFEIDASLFDYPRAAVFELKASFLLDKALDAEDTETLPREIRKKYGKAEGERDKGVAQLARSIGAIARGEWLGDHGQFADITTLYPVLLVHDNRLDTPLFGHFLEQEFRSLLGKISRERHVAPLTVMTIHDLENLERSIEGFSLLGLLADYARECPDRLRSLHNYITSSPYAKKLLRNEQLMNECFSVLDLLKAELFPDWKDGD